MMKRTLSIAAVLLAGSCLAACTDGSVSQPSTPEIQSRQLAQLSAGGGAAGYDLYVGTTRVGVLLVTNGAYDNGNGYYDQMEYWRWDPSSLIDLEAGDLDDISVDFVGTSETWSSSLAANFENGTSSWTAWEVNREFDLQSNYSVVWNQPSNNQILYTMEADAWGGMSGSITYYLKMDFNYSNDYPEMFWYISYYDYQLWLNSESYDEDQNGIYEVRLTDDSVMEQTTVGLGYELKTVK